MIKLGTSNMAKAYVGSTEVSKMYLGSDLVWENGPAYIEIEYLASEGDAKINTGIAGNNDNLSFDFEVMVEPTAYPCYVFGNARSSRKSTMMSVVSSTAAKLRVFAAWSGDTPNFPFSAETRHHIVANRTTTTIDGNSYTNGTGSASNNDYIFALFNGTTTRTGQEGKVTIYYFKIYNGETLVRDYIPVRKGSVGYMYDRVSGEFFGNVGTGNFILGNDKTV